MLEWLFTPIFKTETCVGESISNVTCHTEPFGISPITLIIIGVFLGLLGIASFINKRKEKKMEKKQK
jgi:hypothetical protein